MKLHYSILKDLIELSSEQKQFTPKELRPVLDSLGLEVKNISETSATSTGSNSSNTVFTIETLANRGDHLSALGVARELSARLLTQIKLPQATTELPSSKISYPVFVDTDLCHAISFLELTLRLPI